MLFDRSPSTVTLQMPDVEPAGHVPPGPPGHRQVLPDAQLPPERRPQLPPGLGPRVTSRTNVRLTSGAVS